MSTWKAWSSRVECPRCRPTPFDFGKAVVSCNGVFADDTALVPFSDDGDAIDR